MVGAVPSVQAQAFDATVQLGQLRQAQKNMEIYRNFGGRQTFPGMAS